jgi:exopolysaccharide biosynthesis glucuronosyltransferase PssE
VIFVTVGMHTKGFDRLLKKMDEIAGILNEEVVMQIGHTSFCPQNAKWFDFTTEAGIKEWCKKARVVVTQPAMSVLDAQEQGTPVIVLPRLKKYNEVVDDHQLDFARHLEKEGKVIAVYDIDKLEEALRNVDLKLPKLARDKRLVNALKKYIAQFEPE